MKVNELMIGNWVIDKAVSDKPVQVLQINKANIHYKFGNGYTSIGIDLLEPVPLTDEILEDNGFIETKETHIIEDLGVAIIYGKYERLDEDKMLCHGDSLWPIKYVHQLQNALCLCGINKETVL